MTNWGQVGRRAGGWYDGGGEGGFFGDGLGWQLPLLSGIGGGLDALFGDSGNGITREALGQSTGGLDYWAQQTGQVKEEALNDVDAANMILAGIEPAILEGIDDAGRTRIAQQMMSDRREQEMQDQRLATAGLDSTTVAEGVQRGRSYGQSQNAANISAQFQGLRSNAIAGARGAMAQGMMNRSQVHGQYLDRQLGLQSQKSQILAGVQGQPSAPGYGMIASSIGDSLHTSALLDYLRGNR